VTNVRLAFFALYVVLGVIIVARLLGAGLHPEIVPGVILGILFASLGVYRIAQFLRSRAPQ
jgi:hypothetical protein